MSTHGNVIIMVGADIQVLILTIWAQSTRVATKILQRFWGRAADTGSMIW